MPVPNGLNPSFLGKVTANGFDARHARGTSITVATCNGTTAVNVFGTTNDFEGTLTGVFVAAMGRTAQTITVYTTAGTVGTVTTGNTVGSVTGLNAVIANTALTIAGTCRIASGNASDTSLVYLTYQVNK